MNVPYLDMWDQKFYQNIALHVITNSLLRSAPKRIIAVSRISPTLVFRTHKIHLFLPSIIFTVSQSLCSNFPPFCCLVASTRRSVLTHTPSLLFVLPLGFHRSICYILCARRVFWTTKQQPTKQRSGTLKSSMTVAWVLYPTITRWWHLPQQYFCW